MNRQQELLLTKAKLTMLRQLPYYGTYCIGIDHVEDYSIPTACTTGRQIRFNPFWLLGGETRKVDGRMVTRPLRPVEEVIFVEAHEVLHNTFKHMMRLGWRNMKLANAAADYVVNPILEDGKVGKYPTPWPEEEKDFVRMIDPRFKDMSFEKVYDILEREWLAQGGRDKFKRNGIVIDLRNPGLGDFDEPVNIDGSRLTDAQRAALDRLLDSATSSAVAAAKSHGSVPASVLRLVATALKPKIDWRERLRFFIGKTMPSEYSWARPNRKYLGSLELYLPYLQKTGVGKGLVIMDTSGSVSYANETSEGAQYFSEIGAICEDCTPEQLDVMYCDAQVAGHDVFMMGETPVLKPRGGGGTDFRPPFMKVEKDRMDIQWAVYLTDGYGPFPEKPPPYPVLWVITSDVKAPWGETVRLER